MENEIWKPVKGYEGLYEVSNLAKVRTVAHNMVRRNGAEYPVKSRMKVANKSKTGYMTIALVKENITKNTYLHRILALAFIDQPDGMGIINHKNGIKTDNRIENIEWVNHSINNIHALDMGLRFTHTSVTAEIFVKVKELRGKGLKYADIAAMLKVNKGTVASIATGRSHKRLAKKLEKLQYNF